jgi:hypothetical protein
MQGRDFQEPGDRDFKDRWLRSLPADLAVRRNRPLTRLERTLGLWLSVGAHLLLLLFIFNAKIAPAVMEPPPVTVEILAPPAPIIAPQAGAPPAAKAEKVVEKPTKPKPEPPVKSIARVTPKPPPPTVKTLAAAKKKPEPEEPEEPIPEVSEAQVAGAQVAGSGSGSGAGSGTGSGGGSCDMAAAVQRALRRDALVQAQVAEAQRKPGRAGKPMLVWNGDWVRSHGEEGKGLSAVRQAILWEVGFAPAECRNQRMRGLVLISLNSSRLVLGDASWRWSDLLHAR